MIWNNTDVDVVDVEFDEDGCGTVILILNVKGS